MNQNTTHPNPPAQQQTVAPKSPPMHAVISFFILGLGSILAERKLVGFILLGLGVCNAVLGLIPVINVVAAVMWPVLALTSVIHGYSSARKWNLKHGIIS